MIENNAYFFLESLHSIALADMNRGVLYAIGVCYVLLTVIYLMLFFLLHNLLLIDMLRI